MINKKEHYMYRCIQLAQKGALFAAPNPLVGAIIVHNDIIIGEGYHIKSGTAHAEVNAINSVKNKKLLQQSTLYVSLEPCSHAGKTPPCADLIIKHKIPHVIIGCQDPFNKVNGQGIQKLKNAGVDVQVGVLESECKNLIRRFYTFHQHKRPYIILKWAQSADYFIDKQRTAGNPVIFSTPNSTIITQKRRAEVESILVGTNTAKLDNPRLNVRNWYLKNPIRLVIDKDLKLSQDLSLFDNKIQTWVFTTKTTTSFKSNIKYIKLNFDKNITTQICDFLYQNEIQSVLVEGGAVLLNSFINENLWDEVHIEQSEVILQNGICAPNIKDLGVAIKKEFFGQTFITYHK